MARVGGGLTMKSTVEHRDRHGRIIAVQRNYDRWPKYQAWRAKWCESHRESWAIRGFREGKINPLTLGFAALIRLQEVFKWH